MDNRQRGESEEGSKPARGRTGDGGFRVVIEDVPPSINTAYNNWSPKGSKTVKRTPNRRYEDFKSDLAASCLEQVGVIDLLEGHVEVEIDLHFDNKRRRDVDNYVKVIFDALEGHLYEDDRQVIALSIRKHINEDRSRTVVVVRPRSE